MIIAQEQVEIQHQNFILTNQRAIFWKDNSALIIADLHLGKSAHFRKNGIALPSDLIRADLHRLTGLVEYFEPNELIIVGDFLHAGKNAEFEIFKTWRMNFPNLVILLVKGNHDRIPNQNLLALGVSHTHKTYETADFIFSHEKIDHKEKFVISGHIHPGLMLRNSVKGFSKFPCYVLTKNQLILPAFSSFTGLDTKNHPQNAHYYFFTEEAIFELKRT